MELRPAGSKRLLVVRLGEVDDVLLELLNDPGVVDDGSSLLGAHELGQWLLGHATQLLSHLLQHVLVHLEVSFERGSIVEKERPWVGPLEESSTVNHCVHSLQQERNLVERSSLHILHLVHLLLGVDANSLSEFD